MSNTPSAPQPVDQFGRAWLRGCVGYEIYSRSFSDTMGDGYGDIIGITNKLDYLAWLGIDIVWLTPIYPSPDHDHGYDVADYRSVRTEHGTVADVEALVEKAHSLDLRVIMDIVPNHTSSEHEWFKKAIADPSSPERDMYIFKDPAPDGGPPNNWVSHFGGPAWTLDEASGQYYLHLFVAEQPDLNWRNEAVLDAFDDIYRFWFERGVDGFRIDVAHGLLKHPSFADNPLKHEIPEGAGPLTTFFCYDHVHDLDQDGNIEIFARWQKIAAEYDATLLAESGVEDHNRLARYVGPDALDLTFFLKPSNMRWDPKALIDEHLGLAAVESDGVSWVISNHDNPRPASRFTEELVTDGVDHPDRLQRGIDRSLALNTFHMALGGVPFFYYGDELGLPDGNVDPEHRQDPVATRNPNAGGGDARDVARTPMSWDGSEGNGFGVAGSTPWIISDDRPYELSVEAQRNDPDSTLHRYRALLAARKAHPDLFEAPYEPTRVADDVAMIRRGSTITVTNLSAEEVTVEVPSDATWSVAFASSAQPASVAGAQVTLSAEQSVILVS